MQHSPLQVDPTNLDYDPRNPLELMTLECPWCHRHLRGIGEELEDHDWKLNHDGYFRVICPVHHKSIEGHFRIEATVA